MGRAEIDARAAGVFNPRRPRGFKPANGAWGKRGYTIVTLNEADEADVRHALTEAWRNTAPKQTVKQYDEKNLFGI